MKSYELILMLRKGKAKYIHNMGTSNILRIANIIRNKKHPTEKPVELIQILVENLSNEHDIVFNSLMGVGATGVACVNSNRNFIGYEINKKYFVLLQNRMIDKVYKFIYKISCIIILAINEL